ncbi:uncharacterized mitochondrial protein AtMg00310-like [Carya illinoinensis]|uniref:uncharacterized mitochondrial protein AtMg00310-like n=1 Tax=Carya illinoinensis TaxID=32201 RepID=UPI001C71B398|nr:uncharacterized mitochondrial protein AtMg00310-like [Carya illinoinensis]
MARYWWGQKNEEKKVHWITWKKICKAKPVGGMGFKELQIFNMAMLAKQAWRLLKNRESLFHKMYAARYFSNGDLLATSLGGTPSYAWREIWEAKNLLVKGGRWNVGNGSSIHSLDDA